MNEGLRRYFYSLMTDEARGPAAAALKPLLSLLAFIYLCALEAVKYLYRANLLPSYRAKCKVISIGNITLGGTGKTPVTAAVAGRLKGRGKKVIILTRGYRKDRKTGEADEAEFFKKSLDGIPVIIGRDRIESVKRAEAEHSPDVIVLDDGFQHWRLKRDVDVVTVDVDNPFGNGRVIPRGILREPFSSLARAQVAVVTKVLPEEASLGRAEMLKDRIKRINPDAAVFNASYFPVRLYDVTESREAALGTIDNRPVALLCAIADPASFEDSVVSLGAKVSAEYFFMDHHIFTAGEIAGAVEECEKNGIDTIITTEKDLPRIKGSGYRVGEGKGVKLLALAIEARIDREEEFFGRLDTIFSGKD